MLIRPKYIDEITKYIYKITKYIDDILLVVYGPVHSNVKCTVLNVDILSYIGLW